MPPAEESKSESKYNDDIPTQSTKQGVYKRPLTARRRRPPPLSSSSVNETKTGEEKDGGPAYYRQHDNSASSPSPTPRPLEDDHFMSAQAGETISEINNSDPLLSILNKDENDYSNGLMLAAETGDMKTLNELLLRNKRGTASTASSRSNSINGGIGSNDALHSNTSTDAMTPLHLAAS